jgi:copper(I)-binding protein
MAPAAESFNRAASLYLINHSAWLFPAFHCSLAKPRHRWFNRDMVRAGSMAGGHLPLHPDQPSFSHAGSSMPSFHLYLCAALTTAGLLFGPSVRADPSAQATSVTVRDAWARASTGAAAAVYLTLIGGDATDQIAGISTQIAATADVHESFTDNGIMKMRAAPSVDVPAGKTVTFAPGGYHIMLMGLRQPLVAGQSFPLTVSFLHAAPVTVDVKVQPLGRGPSKGDNAQMPMH